MIVCDGRGKDLLAKKIPSSLVFSLRDVNERAEVE